MALPENLKPVRAGQESGRYLPLQENELDLIHEQVIGFWKKSDSLMRFLLVLK